MALSAMHRRAAKISGKISRDERLGFGRTFSQERLPEMDAKSVETRFTGVGCTVSEARSA